MARHSEILGATLTDWRVYESANRVTGATTDLEATIERNPLAAVLIALGAGIIVGLLSHGRK